MLFAVIDSKEVTEELIAAPMNSKVYPLWEIAEMEKGPNEVVCIVGADWNAHTADPLVMDPSVKYKVLTVSNHPILAGNTAPGSQDGVCSNALAQVCAQAQMQAMAGQPLVCQPVLLNYLLTMTQLFLVDFAKREGMDFDEITASPTEKEKPPVLFGPDGGILRKGG